MIRRELETRYPDAPSRRPQRHAQIQQPGPRDDDGDADGENILAGARQFDVWNVNEDAEYHETARRTRPAKRPAPAFRAVPRKLMTQDAAE